MKLINNAFVVAMLSLATFFACDESSASVEDCYIDLAVTEEELNKFFDGGMKPSDANDNVKCFFKCIMESGGYIRNGMLVGDVAIKALREWPELKDAPNVEQVFFDCKEEQGESDCDTAFKIMMCFVNHELTLQKKEFHMTA